jgi:hypothetical protein
MLGQWGVVGAPGVVCVLVNVDVAVFLGISVDAEFEVDPLQPISLAWR